MIDECFERFPGLDTVPGHAGGCGLHPFGATAGAEYERIFRFNYFGQVSRARAVLAQWIQRKIPGHLICSPLASEINGQIFSPDFGAGIGNRL